MQVAVTSGTVESYYSFSSRHIFAPVVGQFSLNEALGEEDTCSMNHASPYCFY